MTANLQRIKLLSIILRPNSPTDTRVQDITIILIYLVSSNFKLSLVHPPSSPPSEIIYSGKSSLLQRDEVPFSEKLWLYGHDCSERQPTPEGNPRLVNA